MITNSLWDLFLSIYHRYKTSGFFWLCSCPTSAVVALCGEAAMRQLKYHEQKLLKKVDFLNVSLSSKKEYWTKVDALLCAAVEARCVPA